MAIQYYMTAEITTEIDSDLINSMTLIIIYEVEVCCTRWNCKMK